MYVDQHIERLAKLVSVVMCPPLTFIGLIYLVVGYPSGATLMTVLGTIGVLLGITCLFVRGCGTSVVGALALLCLVFILFDQIWPQYRTAELLQSLGPTTQLTLNRNRLEPDVTVQILRALRQSQWQPALRGKKLGVNWDQNLWLTINSGPSEFSVLVGLMGKTPVVRRSSREGLNEGLVTCPGLLEPLQELGWSTIATGSGRTVWVRPKLPEEGLR